MNSLYGIDSIGKIIDDELQRRYDKIMDEAAQIPCAACGEPNYEEDMIAEKWQGITSHYCEDCWIPIDDEEERD